MSSLVGRAVLSTSADYSETALSVLYLGLTAACDGVRGLVGWTGPELPIDLG